LRVLQTDRKFAAKLYSPNLAAPRPYRARRAATCVRIIFREMAFESKAIGLVIRSRVAGYARNWRFPDRCAGVSQPEYPQYDGEFPSVDSLRHCDRNEKENYVKRTCPLLPEVRMAPARN